LEKEKKMRRIPRIRGESQPCFVVTNGGNMQFEWDTEKAKINLQIHRIDFETAARVFLDPDKLEQYDGSHADEEDRWKVIGMVHPAILIVVYTERGKRGEIIRIISARKANERERQAYYKIRT
jgi:uncharacterized DUF497 family protein